MIHAPGEVFDALVQAHDTRWTHSDELLALVLEKLDELCIYTVQAWSKKPPRPRTPYRYPRPQLERKKRKGSTPEQIRRFFRGR